jgi:hypothetical protein
MTSRLEKAAVDRAERAVKHRSVTVDGISTF